MDGDFLNISSSSSSSSSDELILELNRRARRARTFRRRPNNFSKWSDDEFFMRFRLTLIRARSFCNTTGQRVNKAVSPMNQLLLTLRLYATGSMLITTGDFSGVDKSTASRIVKNVTTAICSLAQIYIEMPRGEDGIRKNQLAFYNIARFPRVIGAIDCTHIRIQSPGGDNAEYFRNRKGYFSLNVQVIGDGDLRILDIVARWPGSTHDQTIFNNSRIHARFEGNEFGNSIILGDSGYALQKYLITPLLHPHTEGQQLFNEAQIRSRNPIERLFGVWKRRFPILSLGLRLSLETTQKVIIACAVLHNIAQEKNEETPVDDPDVVAEVDINDEEVHGAQIIEEHDYRQIFIDYFSTLQ
ncbi:hypothetical protein RI129_001448 [Pyrocoelia pectoralis]|uniref:DDE Tnp4 domain-containing protein n=1 Tax=Pyrocoelia pectoralis TaxID=417401 RepID=A0AAN7VYB1_9COLE